MFCFKTEITNKYVFQKHISKTQNIRKRFAKRLRFYEGISEYAFDDTINSRNRKYMQRYVGVPHRRYKIYTLYKVLEICYLRKNSRLYVIYRYGIALSYKTHNWGSIPN